MLRKIFSFLLGVVFPIVFLVIGLSYYDSYQYYNKLTHGGLMMIVIMLSVTFLLYVFQLVSGIRVFQILLGIIKPREDGSYTEKELYGDVTEPKKMELKKRKGFFTNGLLFIFFFIIFIFFVLPILLVLFKK